MEEMNINWTKRIGAYEVDTSFETKLISAYEVDTTLESGVALRK